MKNDVFADGFFVFAGNNRFEYPSLPPGEYATLQFRILEGGSVEVKYDYAEGGIKISDVFVKQLVLKKTRGQDRNPAPFLKSNIL